MKYLVVLVVIVVALWLLLRGRGTPGAAQQRRAPPPGRGDVPAAPIDMVACSHCGVHLPRHDAIAETGGRVYCSAEHRDAAAR